MRVRALNQTKLPANTWQLVPGTCMREEFKIRANGKRLFWRALLVLVVLSAASHIGWAGGMPDEENDQQMPSKAIVGFVKDTDGNSVADARVVVTFTAGNTDLITRSDATGHYRIPGFSKDTSVDNVNISCSKDGYRQAESRKRRADAANANAPIEVDCVLAHE